MDCKYLTKGSILYLPVFAPGGLVATGDIHAYQGDGEIVGGLEVAGEVDLKLEVIKGITEPWPILERMTVGMRLFRTILWRKRVSRQSSVYRNLY